MIFIADDNNLLVFLVCLLRQRLNFLYKRTGCVHDSAADFSCLFKELLCLPMGAHDDDILFPCAIQRGQNARPFFSQIVCHGPVVNQRTPGVDASFAPAFLLFFNFRFCFFNRLPHTEAKPRIFRQQDFFFSCISCIFRHSFLTFRDFLNIS